MISEHSTGNRWFRKAGFLQNLLESVPSCLFVVDNDVRIFNLNSTALKVLGADSRNAVLLKRGGEAVHCLHHSETPEGCGHSTRCADCVIRASVGKAFLGGKTFREITEMALLSGDSVRKVFFMITVSPFAYKGKDFALLAIEDVTEARMADDALRRSHEELEQRVRERTAELVQANRALEAEIADHERAEAELEASRRQLRELLAHTQTVREEERKRIARDLHDELGQLLTALKIDIARLDSAPARADSAMDRSRPLLTLVDEMIGTVKRILSELRPQMLDHLGLAAAVEWQAAEFEKRTGIRCELDLDHDSLDLDDERATAVFRILQEGLTNVARHARASKVVVRLKAVNGHVVLHIEDNGQGLSGEHASKPRSFGLIGIQERVASFGGSVRIAGTAGNGTVLIVAVPRNGL